MPPSRKSIDASIRTLRDMEDPASQLHEAVRLMEKSRDLDVVRAAIGIIGDAADPDLRSALHRKYDACEQRNDGSGYIRAAIVRALQPIVQESDRPLLQRALTTYQMVGLYEVCAELRAAALVTVNDLDPGFAALFAARFLTDPRNSFSGEPARTAIQLLAAQQNLAPIFALASWGNAIGEIIGDALRNLVELPESLLPLLIMHYRDSEDEQVLLGLFDLLLGHATRDDWMDEFALFFRSTTLIDLYGIVAMQIVASRSEVLIGLLRNLAEIERDPVRKSLLDHALELA
ncbi:MAG TPA: hypothetical protein VNZ58_07990 [Thermomicrobiales bacterium]|nr:hypothetical protein [Thermomicrobiales bacterium]